MAAAAVLLDHVHRAEIALHSDSDHADRSHVNFCSHCEGPNGRPQVHCRRNRQLFMRQAFIVQLRILSSCITRELVSDGECCLAVTLISS